MANWVNQRSTITTRNIIRNHLLAQRNIQTALALRMQTLAKELREEMKRNPNMNEERAFEILRKETRKLSKELAKQLNILNNKFNPTLNPLMQDDLSNPINMSLALSNPTSWASLQMNAATDALIEGLNIDAATVAEAMKQEDQNQTAQTDDTTKQFATLGALGHAAHDAIKAFDTLDHEGEAKSLNKICKHITGKEANIENVMESGKKEVQSHMAHVLKPQSLLEDDKKK